VFCTRGACTLKKGFDITAQHPVKKTVEQDVHLKLAIRDIIARNPIVSGHKLCRDLAGQGFKTASGNSLDWFYAAKLVRKLNSEKALAVDEQKIGERLAITKEGSRHRPRHLTERKRCGVNLPKPFEAQSSRNLANLCSTERSTRFVYAAAFLACFLTFAHLFFAAFTIALFRTLNEQSFGDRGTDAAKIMFAQG
jgi:hypothetical protein